MTNRRFVDKEELEDLNTQMNAIGHWDYRDFQKKRKQKNV